MSSTFIFSMLCFIKRNERCLTSVYVEYATCLTLGASLVVAHVDAFDASSHLPLKVSFGVGLEIFG
jgi:hypothetical protein